MQIENGVPNVAAIQQKLSAGLPLAVAQGVEPTLAALVAVARNGRAPAARSPPIAATPAAPTSTTQRRPSAPGLAKDWLVSHGTHMDLAYF